jgi:hypothetical protein
MLAGAIVAALAVLVALRLSMASRKPSIEVERVPTGPVQLRHASSSS